ncbi:MAG: glycosyltransferase family 1 protein [Verrucomicrobiaceae bacterium]|nr:MAG: glycosyltransferase family 1 protein [Verrucomicrobiaceae bacterium]
MKIGFVRRGHSSTGGAEAYLIRLASALASLGHEPVLVTTRDWPESRWVHRGIIRLEGNTPEEFAAAFASARTGCDIHLSLERVPGCEVFRAGDGVHSAWLKRRAGFEPFWKRATRWLNPKHGQLLRLEGRIFDPANTRAIIANSRLVRDEILSCSEFPSERIHVVYNGLSAPAIPADRLKSRKKLGLKERELGVLFVGSGWERKGLRTAIRAVEALDDAILIVAGRGPAEAFRSDRVRFTGPTDELGMLFGAADVFVLPTYYDPFSNACLEALAAGLPVITTPANGFSEIIEPGLHGGVVPEGDAGALAVEIEKWRDAEIREATRGARVARAAEFSIERNARETLRVLESVAAG